MIANTEKVIFDTNSLRCEGSSEYFLGGRSELDKFGKVSEIIIPELVIDEIKAQKEKNLLSKKQSFLENIFHRIRGISEVETKDFDITAFITEQENDEEITYKVIELTDFSVVEKIKELALKNEPPFEKSSDRGFKDAYILFTVLEYLEKNPEEQIYFVTKDERLKEAFSFEKRVRVVADFEDFQRYRSSYFREEYFVQKLISDVDENIQSEHIRDAWLNLNSNWVVLIDTGEVVYRIEIDFSTREVIGFVTEDFTENIETLINAGSFQGVHSSVGCLRGAVQYLSDDEIARLFTAANENEQIFWIAEDEDVKDFYLTLYQGKSNLLLEEDRDNFRSHFPITEKE